LLFTPTKVTFETNGSVDNILSKELFASWAY
jgi:hypothetical protein